MSEFFRENHAEAAVWKTARERSVPFVPLDSCRPHSGQTAARYSTPAFAQAVQSGTARSEVFQLNEP